MKRADRFVHGQSEQEYRVLIDEGAIRRFMMCVLLRLAVLAFAMAFAAQADVDVSSILDGGDRQIHTTAADIR